MPLRLPALQVAWLLGCLSALPAAAQAAPPEPASQEASPPPLVSAPPEPTASEPPPPLVSAPQSALPRGELTPRQELQEHYTVPLVPRIALELMGGAVGGAVGSAPGALVLLKGRDCKTDKCTQNTQLTGGLLVLVGSTVGMASGIKFTSEALGGQSRFEVIYAFEAVALLGVAGSAQSSSLKLKDTLTLSSLFALTLAMGVMGQEFTQAPPRAPASKPAQARARRTLLPTLALTSRGGLSTGLAGTF